MADRSILEQIRNLAAGTREGKVEWSNPNPATWMWVKDLPGKGQIITTLQKVMVRSPMTGLSQESYVFMVRNVTGNEVYISINTGQMPDYESVLRDLLATIEKSNVEKGVNILDQLLKSK